MIELGDIAFDSGSAQVAITVSAVYEQGVLRPLQPLPFQEHEQVRITVDSEKDAVAATYGIIGWKGDAATVERIALDPEFGVDEAAPEW
jgi:predicted DNA-binding antitoxin AbrB/MazE fold protein